MLSPVYFPYKEGEEEQKAIIIAVKFAGSLPLRQGIRQTIRENNIFPKNKGIWVHIKQCFLDMNLVNLFPI